MPITKQNAQDVLVCPHCEKKQEEPAIDYTIHNCVGAESEATEECIECYKPFTVTNCGDGSVDIYVE